MLNLIFLQKIIHFFHCYYNILVYLYIIRNKQIEIMKATYNNSKEIAELYINSKDRTDISVLINESAKMLMQKIGKEEAMKVCLSFMQNKESLYTIEGLENYINSVGIESINFVDPISGKIESTVYIQLKK